MSEKEQYQVGAWWTTEYCVIVRATKNALWQLYLSIMDSAGCPPNSLGKFEARCDLPQGSLSYEAGDRRLIERWEMYMFLRPASGVSITPREAVALMTGKEQER